MRTSLLASAAAAVLTAGLATAVAPSADAGVAAPIASTPIIINQSTSAQTHQVVDPYPSGLTVWGLDGPITDVNVDLNNVTLGRPQDLTLLLRSPEGTALLLTSGVCGTTNAVDRAYWTIDDEAPAKFPAAGPCGSGSWKPSSDSWNSSVQLPAPAPRPRPTTEGYYRTLSAVDGENPNGYWQLFAFDSNNRVGDGRDHGVILGGFRLIITTESRSIVIPAEADGEGPASKYPFVIPVSGQAGQIEDTWVYLHNISHTRPDDLDILLVAPGGQKVLLVSDACGQYPTANSRTWRINDADPAFSDNGNCNLGGAGGAGYNFRPTSYEPGDVLPAPAPGGPYASSLSVLNGTNPNGDWLVYIWDDYSGHSGYLRDVQISFDLGPADVTAPDTTITAGPASVTRARQATFGFSSSESGSTFECRLDSRAWRACSSPKVYRDLARGLHTVGVRATDAAGNTDPTPATRTWRIRR